MAASPTEQSVRVLAWIIARSGTADPTRSANLLLQVFGTIGGVLAASYGQQLRALQGDEASVRELAAFRTAIVETLKVQLVSAPILSTGVVLRDYLRLQCGHARVEHCRILLLDTRLRLIRDVLLTEGTIDQVMVYVREVMRIAIDGGAGHILFVHNHPSGDCSPSRADITFTKQLIAAGKILNVGVLDHIIVSPEEYVAMRSEGWLA